MLKSEKEVRVHLFVSRNKDNLGVENFKPRKVAFVTSEDDKKLERKFLNFVNEGVDGEYCRHYKSLNVRDEEKIREELIVRLVKTKFLSKKSTKQLPVLLLFQNAPQKRNGFLTLIATTQKRSMSF